MKNKWIIVILIASILISSCSGTTPTESLTGYESIPPTIPGELVYIPFPVAITVDGDLTDWAGLPSQTVDTGSLISPDPTENGSFSFSVASDADNFYITMQMPDKNIVAGQHGTDFWNEDSMEFYINASDNLNAAEYGLKMFQVNMNAADIGNTDPTALTITGVFSSDAKATGFVFKTETGWGLEASVPLTDLLTVEHGKEIGFQAQINGATTLDRDVKLIWSKYDTADTSWQNPSLFGRGIFFELGRTDIPQASTRVEVVPTATPVKEAFIIPPVISVNQIGYFIDAKKFASFVSDSTSELDWQLQNGNGEVILSGKSIVNGLDAASKDSIHLIDFSAFNTAGDGYKLIANGLESPAFMISDEIYKQLKLDSLAYYYHNRSGIPIESEFVGADWSRPAGHVTDNNVTCFKGRDADGKTWLGCPYTLDVAGGWYDAGDFGKYVVNGGISVWTLQNLYERFPNAYPDGSLRIPENNNGVSDLLDEARWEMEFLLSMQIPQGQAGAGLVHHKIHDRKWEPIPVMPPREVNNNNLHEVEGVGRYLFPVSTAATLNLAAASAQCARIWKDIDADFAEQCLIAAETAWQAALEKPDIYAGNTPGEGGGNYDDKFVEDEFYWAAVELFITTGKDEYKDYLLNSSQFGKVSQFDWQNTASLGTISLVSVENNLPADKLTEVKQNLLTFADEMIALQNGYGYPALIKGDFPWGANGLILNTTILMGIAYDLSNDSKYLDAMRLSMDYMMGRNPINISYVTGYGTYPMQHPHHRFWANDLANGFPPPPPGALSGGANTNPTDPVALEAGLLDVPASKRYIDDIGSYSTNEVTINWNAPLAWVSTYLDQVK